jgi:hypothetical protein
MDTTTARRSPDHLFSLKVSVGAAGHVLIHAFEGRVMSPNHTRVDVEVSLNREVIFDRGTLYCGIPAQHSLDGVHARENVLSLVAMKPGDTDDEYFENYSTDQLEFADRFGEELSLARETTYCRPRDGGVREDFNIDLDPLEAREGE